MSIFTCCILWWIMLTRFVYSCVFECVKTFWPTTTTFSYIIILLFFHSNSFTLNFFSHFGTNCLFVCFFFGVGKKFSFSLSVFGLQINLTEEMKIESVIFHNYTQCVCVYTLIEFKCLNKRKWWWWSSLVFSWHLNYIDLVFSVKINYEKINFCDKFFSYIQSSNANEI